MSDDNKFNFNPTVPFSDAEIEIAGEMNIPYWQSALDGGMIIETCCDGLLIHVLGIISPRSCTLRLGDSDRLIEVGVELPYEFSPHRYLTLVDDGGDHPKARLWAGRDKVAEQIIRDFDTLTKYEFGLTP